MVHFLERFYEKGYEKLLLASVLRQPTELNLWMLNRVINGSNEADKERFLSALQAVWANPSLGSDIRLVAQHFLRFQESD